MTAIDTRPASVPITAYAGDTLTIRVTAPWALVNGREWSAQIRSARDAPVDATFDITPPAMEGDPAYLVLPAAEAARLAGTSPAVAVRTIGGAVRMVATYSGVWDVQVSGTAGADPVTTLAQGDISFEADVTRVGP